MRASLCFKQARWVLQNYLFPSCECQPEVSLYSCLFTRHSHHETCKKSTGRLLTTSISEAEPEVKHRRKRGCSYMRKHFEIEQTTRTLERCSCFYYARRLLLLQKRTAR